jgi:hypothetical protein
MPDWLLSRLLLYRNRTPAQDRLSRRRGFIEPPPRRQQQRLAEARRIAGPSLD